MLALRNPKGDGQALAGTITMDELREILAGAEAIAPQADVAVLPAAPPPVREEHAID